MSRKIIIGSRGSDLALWQANYTKSALENLGHEVEIKIIKTQGDKIQHLSFDKLEGKGFFTKELEDALINGEIDLAVHSHKDLPTSNPQGLCIAAVSYREDCSETILIRKEAVDPSQLLGVKSFSRFGTSSVRRSSQLQFFRPDLQIMQLRGNVPTRVEKLKNDEYDAIMLASAGLERLKLDLSEFHIEKLDPRWFIPAPAQGVLAFQIRESDESMKNILHEINHADVASQIYIERKVLNLLDGGCQLPLGVYVEKKDAVFKTWASLKPLDGAPLRRFYIENKDADLVIQKLIKGFNEGVKGKVFITREPEQCKVFTRLLEGMGMMVIAKSLIKTEPQSFKLSTKHDWVFFTSANAVEHFFEQAEPEFIPERIAAIGSGTAKKIRMLGLEPDFEGGAAKNTQEIAKDFIELYAGTSVLFPQSDIAVKHVSEEIAKHCKTEKVVVYNTKINLNRSIPDADMLVFTSPSNLNAYIETKGIPQKPCIAIGTSTAEALKMKGIKQIHVAHAFDQLALADLAAGLALEVK